MNFFKNLFLFKKQSVIDNQVNHGLVDKYGEIAKLVKYARMQKNITIQQVYKININQIRGMPRIKNKYTRKISN